MCTVVVVVAAVVVATTWSGLVEGRAAPGRRHMSSVRRNCLTGAAAGSGATPRSPTTWRR